ncbi:hypothetical protein ACFV6F_30600 [Kitasatospora phosalacinea]|uniref:hypothetical protein n=1 Tax=Kitasatospora phosalacinea TaxID=2065 RepID=UPI0036498CA5
MSAAPERAEPDVAPEEADFDDADSEGCGEPAPGRSGGGAVPSARRSRRRPTGPGGRALRWALAAVGALVLAAGAWSVPVVRTELLDSFTERPRPYTELYFDTTPTFEGATVLVPVAVIDHGGGGTSGYQVRVVLESAEGKLVDSTTVQLAARYNAPVSAVVKLHGDSSAALVRVSLVGHAQTLHYRFGKVQLPDR